MNKLALFALAALFAAGLAPAHAQSPTPAAAAMPTCASGDAVVWENTKSKKHVYHMSGDKYYGTGKGKYVCESQAKTDGYHAAGSMGHHHHMGMASPAPSPAAT
jgi:hypothetical protein